MDAAHTHEGRSKLQDVLPSAQIVVLGLLSILTLRFLLNRVRAAFEPSLRHIPGPLHARFTGLGLKFHDVIGNRWYWVQHLHKTYGPTVRIAPDEIAVCDPKDVKKLHGLGTSFRKRQQPGTAFNIFSMSDPRQHRARQRFYTKVFSEENLQQMQPAIRKLSEICVRGIKNDAQKSPQQAADLFKWSMLFGHDVAWHVVYNDADREGLMVKGASIDDVIMGCYLQKQNSWMLFCFPIFLICRFAAKFVPQLRDTFRVDYRYVDLFMEGPRQAEVAPKTVFWDSNKYAREGDSFLITDDMKLTKFDICRDSKTFLGAGGEAVGATLVYLIWCVLKDQDLQRKLEEEVAGLDAEISHEACAQLPYLNGVIFEALRLYGGGATHLPRYSAQAVQFGKYTVPPGVAVTSHNGALHRNPKAWDRPEVFDPLRWSDATRSKSMIQDDFQPFSAGARACIAIHLVLIEMRIFVATYFRAFRGQKLASSVTEASMTIVDRFHIAPASRSMEVVVM